ncbi:DoxX family protein [Streptomyces sp. SID5910]|uniref:DoxX family protein n=1 Tax=Streptomyces sp. SID5910 TaxID=2690312 RepID=UPI00136ACFB9|nr:DoxX family protein [Streptomyces sp. SID5910]MYR43473.1 DoxX family membrane protein [Streptomyces sp. SID5910]
MSGPETSSGDGAGQAARIGLWVCQALLGLVFLAAGSAKLFGAAEMVAAFHDIGAGQWLRYFVGVVELVGVLGLLIPRLAGPAALGLAGLMTGAVITNLVIDAFSLLAVVLLLLSITVAWGRRDSVRAVIRPATAR